MATISEELRTALQRLASSPADQETFLRELGTAPSVDELAIEFSDMLGVLQGSLEEPALSLAIRLDRYLEGISGGEHADLWTVSALHSAQEWARVRRLAGEVLEALDASGA